MSASSVMPLASTWNGPLDARPPRWVATFDLRLVLIVALVASIGMGAFVALGGVLALAALIGLALVVTVAAHPPAGAYVLLGLTPLVAGIDRGVVLPLLRPHEALLVAVAAGLMLRAVHGMAQGRTMRLSGSALDGAIVAMAVTSSVVPLVWMVSRGAAISIDDLLYATTLWKFLALFWVVRACVRDERQVRTCLWLTMASGAVVAALAVLQALQLFGVPGLLVTVFAPENAEDLLFIGRGTSTLGSSHAVGGVMAFNLAIALALLLCEQRHRTTLVGLASLFALGAFASGQFSAVIGVAIIAFAVAVLCGRFRQVFLAGAVAVPVSGILLAPVLQARLAGIDQSTGMPQSWVARLDNLERFFWPHLFDRANWLLGVRPSARVAAPEVWREWVYIESGYTWLLWNGGVPLLVAFVVFAWLAISRTAVVARTAHGATAVAATAACAALWVVVVLMLFDPHLTLRGTGDLLFALLALGLVGATPGVIATRQSTGKELL